MEVIATKNPDKMKVGRVFVTEDS